MTWFADGSPCDYFNGVTSSDFFGVSQSGERLIQFDRLVAIGWLDGSQQYERGQVEPEFETKLREIVRSAWAPVGSCGDHSCNLSPCRRLPELRRASGVHNLFVPGKGFAYASPELIVHYVSEHAYAPPEPFRAAVMACPPMSSDAYFDAMSENGPTQWLVDLECKRISQHEPETMEAIYRQLHEWRSQDLGEEEVESRFDELVLSTARRFH